MFDVQDLQQKAGLLRKWSLIATTAAGSGHPTSCLSAADFTAVLFDRYFTCDVSNPLNIYNDRFTLSKGHAAPLLYALFGMAGAYPLEEIKTLRCFGSRFEGHPVPAFEFTEAATGSLGQGLSVGAGLALVAKRDGLPFKSYVVLGDGELAEGQVWEAANFASYYQLDNLIALIDMNRLAQSGETMWGQQVEQYEMRFRAFGFTTVVVDGHHFEEIDQALQQAVSNTDGKPFAIIAGTRKGKGISFLEDKEDWHGKALKEDDLQKALDELGPLDDMLHWNGRKPEKTAVAGNEAATITIDLEFESDDEYATREVVGEAMVKAGEQHGAMYVLDGDVKNSTFTEGFAKAFPRQFIQGFIAEQNIVSVAAGLSRLGKVPFVATFAAFLTRAADQVRMARISGANIKFIGSHTGVAIGEDGPSQMGLEDIALFGAQPGTVILQPADAVSAAALLPEMMAHHGFVYMRTLRGKTKLLYNPGKSFSIGGSAVLRQSDTDVLTVAATGITVFEALQAANSLATENIYIRVLDIYSIHPIDKAGLIQSVEETKKAVIVTVEDHYEHGGMGDFVTAAVSEEGIRVVKLAVKEISQSGKSEELLQAAGIDAAAIIAKVKELV